MKRKVDNYEKTLEELGNDLSEKCVRFLMKEESLEPYRVKVLEIDQSIEALEKVIDATKLEEKINATSKELEMFLGAKGV